MDQEKLVIVGRIGKAYGIKGWVNLHSFTQPIENILDYQPWLMNYKGTWQAIEVETCKAHGKGFVAKFAMINSPEAAKAYVNLELAVTREQLPELTEEEVYWHDLLGLTVVNKDNVELGVVRKMLETGANDVLVVQGEKEHLIPCLLKQFVLEIDLTNNRIIVDWDPEF